MTTTLDKRIREDKTTVRENRDGNRTIKFPMRRFPEELHQKIKDTAHGNMTVSDAYSHAVSVMRGDYDSGADIKISSVPEKGIRTQIWLLEKAHSDMEYLSNKLKVARISIVYNAAIRYFANK